MHNILELFVAPEQNLGQGAAFGVGALTPMESRSDMGGSAHKQEG